MGQIQNSITSATRDVVLAKTGAELLKPERERQAVEAQGKANTYANTEVKDAYMKSLDADKKLSEAEGEAAVVFDRYGVQTKVAPDYTTIVDWRADESKLSKNKGWRNRQISGIRAAVNNVNTAANANAVALEERNFKKSQYKAFRKRAEALSRKAKINMPGILSKDAMIAKEEAWNDEYWKGGKK